MTGYSSLAAAILLTESSQSKNPLTYGNTVKGVQECEKMKLAAERTKHEQERAKMLEDLRDKMAKIAAEVARNRGKTVQDMMKGMGQLAK